MESIPELKKICQKKIWSQRNLETFPCFFLVKHFYLRVSIYITRILLIRGVSANRVTVSFFVVGNFACFFFLRPEIWAEIIAVLFMQLRYILDCVDGEIARYRKTSSLTGCLFDSIEHYYFGGLLFMCIGYGLFVNFQNQICLLLGFISSFFYFLNNIHQDVKGKIFYSEIARQNKGKGISEDDISRKKDAEDKKNIEVLKSPLSKIIRFYTLFPGIMNIITLAVLLNLLYEKFVFLGIPMNALFVVLVSYSFIYPIAFFKTLFLDIKNKVIESRINSYESIK